MLIRTKWLLAIAFGGIFAGGFIAGRETLVAQEKSRIFEIRTYTTEDGKVSAVVNRMRRGEATLFEKAGMKGVLYSVAAESPKSANTFVYIVAHQSLDSAKRSWDSFRQDPEFAKLRDSMEATGPIKVESTFVTPTDFSPLK